MRNQIFSGARGRFLKQKKLLHLMACFTGGKNCLNDKFLFTLFTFLCSCYSCADCNKGMEAGRGCDAPNREVYCKACYGNLFGLHGYGFGGFGSLPALTAGGGEVKTEYHYTQFF